MQLRSCVLNCPYCYVTFAGIWGKPVWYTTNELIDSFIKSKQDVFHLMGGSPAIYINYWDEILNKIPQDKVFHSDLMLIEKRYDIEVLRELKKENAIYAVNIKGVTSEDFYLNTKRKFNEKLFWSNLYKVVKSEINFYITFTNPDKKLLDNFKCKLISLYGDKILDDSFIIDIIQYKALSK